MLQGCEDNILFRWGVGADRDFICPIRTDGNLGESVQEVSKTWKFGGTAGVQFIGKGEGTIGREIQKTWQRECFAEGSASRDWNKIKKRWDKVWWYSGG